MKNNFLNRVDAESFRYAIQGLYSSKESDAEFRELRKLVSKTENAQASPTIPELLLITAVTAIITGTACFFVYQKRRNQAPVVD